MTGKALCLMGMQGRQEVTRQSPALSGNPACMGTCRLEREEGEQTLWKVRNPTWPLFWGGNGVVSASCYSAMCMGPTWDGCQGWVGSWGDKTTSASHWSVGVSRKWWDLLLKGHPSNQELLEFPLEQQWMGNASDPGMEMWSHRELRGGLFPGLGAEMLSWYYWVKKTQPVL